MNPTSSASPSAMPAATAPRAASRSNLWVAVVLILLALGITFVAPGYQLFQGTMVLSYAIALLGLNILTG